MLTKRSETLKISLLAIAILAGCSAELFYTPAEIRGVWKLEGYDRVLVVSERSISVYDAAQGQCSLDYRQDFAGPRLSDWEVFPSADAQAFRFREPGKDTLIEARRLTELPDRCVVGQ